MLLKLTYFVKTLVYILYCINCGGRQLLLNKIAMISDTQICYANMCLNVNIYVVSVR